MWYWTGTTYGESVHVKTLLNPWSRTCFSTAFWDLVDILPKGTLRYWFQLEIECFLCFVNPDI